MWCVRCFLLLTAFCFAIGPADSGPLVSVQGVVGGVAILDFRFQHPSNAEVVTLDWTNGLLISSVLAVRDNCEIHKDQNKDYEFRAAYFKDEWKNGNGSLRLSDLRPEDTGTYHGRVLWNDRKMQDVLVQLRVVAGPPEATPTPEAPSPAHDHTLTVVATVLAVLVTGLAMGLFVSIRLNIKQASTIRSLSNTETSDSQPAGLPQQESGDLMANHKSTVRPDRHWALSYQDLREADSHQNQQESVRLSVAEGSMPAEGNRLLN